MIPMKIGLAGVGLPFKLLQVNVGTVESALGHRLPPDDADDATQIDSDTKSDKLVTRGGQGRGRGGWPNL